MSLLLNAIEMFDADGIAVWHDGECLLVVKNGEHLPPFSLSEWEKSAATPIRLAHWQAHLMGPCRPAIRPPTNYTRKARNRGKTIGQRR